MKKNYDRIDLLNQAYEYTGKDAAWLSRALRKSIIEIHQDLESDNFLAIFKISRALGVPEAFFWGGLRIENGELVPNDPE